MDSIFGGDLRGRGRWLAWADSLLVDHGLLRLGWSNFATVVPGRLYRSNHPTPARLARMARRLGLRTVVNLRGRTGSGSDALSREAAGRRGLVVLDVPLRSGRAPTRAELLDLVAALRRADGPALLHCKSGADRAGFAAGVFLLLEGVPVAVARRQLSWRFGHVRGGRAGALGLVFDAYAVSGVADFAAWVRHGYDPAALDHRAGRVAGLLHDRVLARE